MCGDGIWHPGSNYVTPCEHAPSLEHPFKEEQLHQRQSPAKVQSPWEQQNRMVVYQNKTKKKKRFSVRDGKQIHFTWFVGGVRFFLSLQHFRPTLGRDTDSTKIVRKDKDFFFLPNHFEALHVRKSQTINIRGVKISSVSLYDTW